MPVIVCRHGTTPWNAENRWQGQCDIELSDEGIAQAEDHAAQMRDHPTWQNISRVISSPLKRALRTAEICSTIRAPKGITVEVDERLKESKLGKFEGLTMTMILDTEGDLIAYLEALSPAERNNARYDEGLDTPKGAANRMLEMLNEVEKSNPDDTVLVVTHSQMMYALLAAVQGAHFQHIRSRPLAWFVYAHGKISDINNVTIRGLD
eukprot:GEMP01084609.1.p1 GENE.GEMP01084609.1~~GEMP01084609.1.p1  ORF type:complete len:208 (+),score=37.31 GEMP01084609.1:58-681(+)